VAVFEIMVNNLRVQDIILHGESEDKTFYEIMETSQPFGCQTFDQDIISKFNQNLISEETAVLYASRRAITQRGIDQIKSRRGEKTTDIEDLTLDQQYQK
jgi:twitching motility protein PilT